MDTDHSKTLELTDFKWGLKNYGLNFNVEEVKVLFKHFDKNSNGSLDFGEFISTIRVNYTAYIN
jgi:Ca2+-binding EF-hand superfamily protein